MATKRDYYEVLEVERTATVEVIKKSYRKLAAKYHPDRNPGDEEAIVRFKEAAEAFDVLSNPDKRSRYDRFGHDAVSGAAGAGQQFHDVQDIMDAFGDLFGDLFGGSGGGRRRGGGGTRARRGDSLRTSLTIDLADAAVGCVRDLQITRHVACETCEGSGAKPGTSPVTCDYCGGRGQVIQSQGFFRMQTTCPACRGAGSVIREKCGDCRGAGQVEREFSLEVKVPGGVDTGMQLCLRGEGDPGFQGGPAGDLYVDIHVKPHRFFQRDGKNLVCEIPITFSQAALGTEVEIPLLSGRHTVSISAGTQPGEVIRMRGMGLPDVHGGSRGDLLAQIHVEVPKKLTRKQEELLREFAELEDRHVGPRRKGFFEQVKEFFTGADEEPS